MQGQHVPDREWGIGEGCREGHFSSMGMDLYKIGFLALNKNINLFCGYLAKEGILQHVIMC